jgi:hypothetical protein
VIGGGLAGDEHHPARLGDVDERVAPAASAVRRD